MREQKPREIAVQVLLRRQNAGQFTETLVDEALSRNRLQAHDRALVRQLVYGVVRWERTLDWLIARKTSHRPAKPALEVLLRIGLFQIFWLDRIPDHAAVHETVALSKDMGLVSQAGFINAVLRGFLRDEGPTRAALDALKLSDMALGHSHPDWLVSRWKDHWGAAKTGQLLEWNNKPARAFARINELKGSFDELRTLWASEGVTFEEFQAPWLDRTRVVVLTEYPPLESLRSFSEGRFYVQDPSTILAVNSLNPREGERILDLCAAPGGKTTLIGQQIRDVGEVWAFDLEPDRLKLVAENATRLGVKSLRLVHEASEFMNECFDAVLVDAPCSNTGVLRRRVDLRWRIRPEEIARLQQSQLDILKMGAGRVRRGGRLVYSTCSLEEEENQSIIKRFLAENNDFILHQETQLHPAEHDVDGAYVAALRRRDV